MVENTVKHKPITTLHFYPFTHPTFSYTKHPRVTSSHRPPITTVPSTFTDTAIDRPITARRCHGTSSLRHKTIKQRCRGNECAAESKRHRSIDQSQAFLNMTSRHVKWPRPRVFYDAPAKIRVEEPRLYYFRVRALKVRISLGLRLG